MTGSYARVYDAVRRIPRGRVATYGQIARLAGIPRHARQVGYALAALLDGSDVPWHRVINAKGEVSPRAEPDWEEVQTKLLEREGVRFDGHGRVSLARFGWAGETGAARPTPAALRAARGRTIPDVIAPGLRVLFSGINPSLYSAATGHHFARPGNRFWRTLHAAGFTPRQLAPAEQRGLLEHGLGITNLVARATAQASELSPAELVAGRGRLAAKVRRLRPAVVAVLGVEAYRRAFARPHAALGPQPEGLAGAALWVLPNPSGLNAHYQLRDLVALYRRLRNAVRSKRSAQ
jgi:TDG/mug DNA glycosylase family protein